MALARGAKLGSCEILDPIGAGGMGQVYRGRDTRLGRDVAVKTLPDEFAKDPEWLARFEREAQALAALNHPNIAIIHDLKEAGGFQYLILELVEGDTLADRIASGPIPVDEVLAIARQIAEALEAAHEKGIVHRDMKPANVKVTPEGRVKVLDFGLAKIYEPRGASQSRSNSPTLSIMQTGDGMILGTAAYMSPEQARGKNVDRRTDIWGFGCVLYEMLTGHQAFPNGETVADTLVGVLSREPDWQALPSATPAKIRALLERCLRKDPRRRLPDIAGARIEIEESDSESTVRAPAATAQASRTWHYVWVTLALVFFLSTAGLILREILTKAPETVVARFDIALPEGMTVLADVQISPDGRQVAFYSNQETRIWLRSIDSSAPQPLAGTEGTTGFFWSPDSAFIGFIADGRLKKVAVKDGAAVPLGILPAGLGHQGTWSVDGAILVGGVDFPLFKMSSTGGQPTPVTQLDASGKETGHGFPNFLPDGQHYFFLAFNPVQGSTAYIGALNSSERRPLPGIQSEVRYSPSGHVLFLRDGVLMAQPFDVNRLELGGEALPVVEDALSTTTANTGMFSVSDIGSLVYRVSSTTAIEQTQLAWFDRGGNELGLIGKKGAYVADVELSPNGKYAAFRQGNPAHVFVLDIDKGITERLTSGPASNIWPVWSRDSQFVAFRHGLQNNLGDLYKRAFGTAGESQLVLKSDEWKNPSDWTSDYLIYIDSQFDLFALPLSGDPKPIRLTETPWREYWAKVSPDGQWIAYQSNQSGRPTSAAEDNNIYIESFPKRGFKRQVSVKGGVTPRWHPLGTELYYVAPDNTLMAVSIKPSGTSLDISAPVSLFRPRFVEATRRGNYNVAPDGRFLISLAIEEQSVAPITVILNWASGLKK
jgi:Tol biopolymer transport system component